MSAVRKKGDFDRNLRTSKLEFEKQTVKKFYNSPILGFVSRMRVNRILGELGDVNGKTILDAGCGAGYVSILIAERGAKVLSFDIYKPAVEEFKKKVRDRENLKIRSFVGCIDNIPLKSESVDSVVCTEVLEYVPDIHAALKELNRVIRKGGKMIVTFPNESLRKLIYPMLGIAGIDTKSEKDYILFSYSMKEMLNMLSKSFRIVKKYKIPSYILPITNIIVCEKN
jgi:2-polyprenyl-3-methyl-5-hydroxy-6-metoxy-1,4-benzoquinol methylase